MGIFLPKEDFMAFIKRFSTIERGGIVFTGNTLGLSKLSNSISAGVQGSIGAFTSLNNTQVSNFPVGTTSNYLQNGSSAQLSLPQNSTVLYAELVWGGLYKSQNNNIGNLIDNNIIFSTSTGDHNISPELITAQTFLIPTGNFTVGFYVRTANVTQLVQQSLSGTYSVKSIPALIIAQDSQTSDTNHAGWTLCVVYKNDNSTLRNLTLWTGGAVVGPNTTVSDTTLTGFLTPITQPIQGKIFMSAQEGDAVISGDQFLFGKDSANLSVMSGPNNPAGNFFCSQINNSNGLIDTTGTFGTRNANAQTGSNIPAGRQGWDITAIDISNYLSPSQSSALLRFTSSGDLYVPNALAIQVDSLGASLNIVKSVDKNIKFVGENINYTLDITNTGQIPATNISVNDLIPTGLQLVSNSIFVDGVQQSDTIPISIPQIAPNQSVKVTYSLIANSVPIINPAVNIASATFSFEPFPGFPITVTNPSNAVSVVILQEAINLIKTVDYGYAIKGDILTYTSYMTNNGNLLAQNLVFYDTIPQGTTFVENSVKLDDVAIPGANPQNGININSLNIGEVKKIEFQVSIN